MHFAHGINKVYESNTKLFIENFSISILIIIIEVFLEVFEV